MFTNFKSQFLWCIMCTFLTGIIVGSLFTMIDLGDNKLIISLMSICAILSVIFTCVYWKNIFSRLDLQDKINSIWNHD